MFKCEWSGCDAEFETKQQLTGHMMSHKRSASWNQAAKEKPVQQKPAEEPSDVKPDYSAGFGRIGQPQNLTAEEAAIFQRVMSESNDWQTITEDEMNDFSLIADPFDLPPEARKRQNEKQFAFRWAARKSERVDELRSAAPPLRWMIANKTTCPWLSEKDVDPILGCVPRLDQMLFFKPWAWHERVRAAKMELAENQDRTGDIKRRHGMKDKGGNWMYGEQFRITQSDEVMADESMMDAAMGIREDFSQMEPLEE